MKLIDSLVERARGSGQRIVLSEGEDPRIVEGAVRAQAAGVAVPVLVGSASAVEAQLKAQGSSSERIEVIDPQSADLSEKYAQLYHQLRAHKGMDEEKALAEARSNPLAFAALMVKQGDADATIGGAVHTTGDTVRAALQIIGRAEGVKTVSSFFLMFLEQPHHGEPRMVLFGDCALLVEPSVEELAQIAVSSAQSCQSFTGNTPKVAMLSFSTAGSANHPRVTHVAEAAARAKELAPGLAVEGDIQFDAAFVPSVAAKKAPESELAGHANVFVFPSLEAGNIGYKIAQRIGGADAVGPILQGLAKPANDLSRGCSAADVFKLMALTAVQGS